ncbi:unnamed protein product, partial [Didymodactylos carnosus]
ICCLEIMVRFAQKFALFIAITGSLFGYLYHIPHSEGIDELGKVRFMSAPMKIIDLVGTVSEAFGITTKVNILKSCTKILKRATRRNMNAQTEDTEINNVPVRIYRSKQIDDKEKSLHPAIIYYHGGGFYMGSLETHNDITKTLAKLTGFIVISVDYRLAPEHPFPTGLDDCYQVTKYLFDHGKKFQIDHERIVLAGDSA